MPRRKRHGMTLRCYSDAGSGLSANFLVKEARRDSLASINNKSNKRGDFYRPFYYCVQALLLDNSLSGALCSAGTALNALVSVDLIVQIAHVDRFSGALCSAGTAGQALISDNKSHSVTSVCYLTIHLLGI